MKNSFKLTIIAAIQSCLSLMHYTIVKGTNYLFKHQVTSEEFKIHGTMQYTAQHSNPEEIGNTVLIHCKCEIKCVILNGF